MTATVSSFSPYRKIGTGTQLPPGASLANQASSQAGYGQLMTLDASGNMALNDGTAPGLLSGGVCDDKTSELRTGSGDGHTSAWHGFGAIPFSAGSGDGFTAADKGGIPAFIATEGTIGRKSNVSGSNRSIAGMVYGVTDDGLAIFWGGPVAQAVARSLLLLNTFPLASHGIADAAASTATAERAVSFRPGVKGTVTSVTFTGAVLAIGDTDYVTATISKRDGAGGGAVSLATYDSRAAGNGAVVAFTPKSLTLSVVAGALYLLETDVITITTTKGGSGQVLTGSFLVNGKAI